MTGFDGGREKRIYYSQINAGPDRSGRVPQMNFKKRVLFGRIGGFGFGRLRKGQEVGTASGEIAAGMVGKKLGAAGGSLVGVFHDGTALPMAIQIAGYGLAARILLLVSQRKTDRNNA